MSVTEQYKTMNDKPCHDMMDVEQEFVEALVIGIDDTINEVITMVKNGYELSVNTWLDRTLEYGQQRKWEYIWKKIND